MYHVDNSDLLATHYCAARNQRRFRLVPSSEHMVGLKITFLDANHHL